MKNPLTYSKDEIQLTNEPTQFQADLMGAQVWQLNSPEFKKWFGESKVKTLAGKPAVLFHGTCASGFTKFDPTKTREMGFHFGTIPQAKDFLKGCTGRPFSRGNKPAIYPVYLSIQKPLFTPDLYSEDPTYFAEWLERTNHIHEWFPDESDSYYQSLNKLRDQRTQARALGGREAYELVSRINKKIWGLMRKIVTRKGYDGIRYKNENEGDTDSPSNIAWIALSPAQVKSATQNLGKFNRRDPNLLNPLDPRAAMTQNMGTKGTYISAAPMLSGRVLDYGAGYGVGTDILRSKGLQVDSYEPFPEKWKGKRPPTHTKSDKIPSNAYNSVVSFSVINVVDPDERKRLFNEIARVLRPGGVALITGRTRSDVEAASTKVPHLEPGGFIIGEGIKKRYQKGFTQAELEQYAKKVLGPKFTVEANGTLNGASIIVVKDPSALLNPYTKPELRERLKRQIMAGDKGGRPGQWSARKAQLLAAEYRKAGGGYTGKWAKSQRSLIKWMYQDWRTKSGKPSLETGERYLPAKAIEALTSAEYAATTAAKRKATGQFSRQPAKIAAKTKEFRNPMTRSILSRIIEPGDRVLCYDTAKGEDFYRLWDLIHTDQSLNTESLREIEGMLDDDGVLVIESGEEPPGLRDHFRRAFRYQKLLLVQGPLNPEEARINTEKERRESE